MYVVVTAVSSGNKARSTELGTALRWRHPCANRRQSKRANLPQWRGVALVLHTEIVSRCCQHVVVSAPPSFQVNVTLQGVVATMGVLTLLPHDDAGELDNLFWLCQSYPSNAANRFNMYGHKMCDEATCSNSRHRACTNDDTVFLENSDRTWTCTQTVNCTAHCLI